MRVEARSQRKIHVAINIVSYYHIIISYDNCPLAKICSYLAELFHHLVHLSHAVRVFLRGWQPLLCPGLLVLARMPWGKEYGDTKGAKAAKRVGRVQHDRRRDNETKPTTRTTDCTF